MSLRTAPGATKVYIHTCDQMFLTIVTRYTERRARLRSWRGTRGDSDCAHDILRGHTNERLVPVLPEPHARKRDLAMAASRCVVRVASRRAFLNSSRARPDDGSATDRQPIRSSARRARENVHRAARALPSSILFNRVFSRALSEKAPIHMHIAIITRRFFSHDCTHMTKCRYVYIA